MDAQLRRLNAKDPIEDIVAALQDAGGVIVLDLLDAEILDGKALVGKYGYGCEPASGASVAGLRKLIDEKMIAPTDRVVCILTGHALKDSNATIDYHGGARQEHARFANPPTSCAADLDAVARLI